jgi:hypothetical protein
MIVTISQSQSLTTSARVLSSSYAVFKVGTQNDDYPVPTKNTSVWDFRVIFMFVFKSVTPRVNYFILVHSSCSQIKPPQACLIYVITICFELTKMAPKSPNTETETTKPVKFAPSCPYPFIIPTELRITMLKRLLDPKDKLYTPVQKANVEKLLEMYESGEMTEGRVVRLMEGKEVTAKDLERPKTFFWVEVCIIDSYR